MKRQKLVQARLAQGLTIRDMARLCNTSYVVIYRTEHGSIPRPNIIPKIARAYGMEPGEFVTLLYEAQ